MLRGGARMLAVFLLFSWLRGYFFPWSFFGPGPWAKGPGPLGQGAPAPGPRGPGPWAKGRAPGPRGPQGVQRGPQGVPGHLPDPVPDHPPVNKVRPSLRHFSRAPLKTHRKPVRGMGGLRFINWRWRLWFSDPPKRQHYGFSTPQTAELLILRPPTAPNFWFFDPPKRRTFGYLGTALESISYRQPPPWGRLTSRYSSFGGGV